MNGSNVDVLVVGAGPVGLTLANDLAARGVALRIVDQLAEPNRQSRAHGMQSRTLEALDAIDLARPMMEVAQNPQPPLVILDKKAVVARVRFDRFEHHPYPYQVILWQQRVQQVLERALETKAVRIERSSKLLGFEMDASGVTARVARAQGEDETIRASWIVGCDGGHSTVRQVLGLPMHGAGKIPDRFLIGEVDVEWTLSRNEMYEWWHPVGMAAAIFVDFTDKWHVLVEHNDDALDQATLLPVMERMLQERAGDPSIRVRNPAWIHDAVFFNGMPERFIVGRAILAGDAAHVHSAAGGQGMNTGIQDALNLGWKLALTTRGDASSGLLQSYEAERLPNARSLLQVTRTYHAIQVPGNALARRLAGLFFRAMSSNSALGAAIAAKVGMLNIEYEKGPLSLQRSRDASKRTRAGWRIIDTPCTTVEGDSTLFDLVRGTNATLLLFAGTEPNRDSIEALRAIHASVARLASHLTAWYVFGSREEATRLGVADRYVVFDDAGSLQSTFGLRKPEILYVRPDGYIGLRTNDLGSEELRAYLTRVYA